MTYLKEPKKPDVKMIPERTGLSQTEFPQLLGVKLNSELGTAVATNVLVRLVTRDDAKQVAAADAFVEKRAWVSQLTLAEATGVLSAVYDLDAAAIATAIEMLLSHKDLTREESEVIANALEMFRRRPALSFADCLMLEPARKAGHLPLGTFDRNVGKLEGAQRL